MLAQIYYCSSLGVVVVAVAVAVVAAVVVVGNDCDCGVPDDGVHER